MTMSVDFFSVIPTQCTYSGMSVTGLPAVKDDVRFL